MGELNPLNPFLFSASLFLGLIQHFKVAGFASSMGEYKKAIEIYEQVASASLESSLLKWSVKDYFLRAGICHLAAGDAGDATRARERYEGFDASFASTREGPLLGQLTKAFEEVADEAFTEAVREYDEISRLDAQKTSLLLEAKKKIKASQNDIT